jgi:glutamine amidotransferase
MAGKPCRIPPTRNIPVFQPHARRCALSDAGSAVLLRVTLRAPNLMAVIALIDYGSGNLRSVHKALLKVGADVRVVRSAPELADARAVVLPGVGAFDDCVHAMDRQGLLTGSREAIKAGKPFLGICVGYQALFEKSEEFNSCAAGLGVFQGKVVRFSDSNGLKVPQIGWNQLDIVKRECPLLKGVTNGSYVYFVHSFFPQPVDGSIVATRTDYGQTFASAVWRDNVFATQFHPEKSQAVGLQLLKNFVDFADRN